MSDKINSFKETGGSYEEMFDDAMGLGEVFVNEEDRKACVGFLTSEIDAVKGLKATRTKRIDKWRRQSQGKPETETKDFPWPKASNLVDPMTLTAVNGMTSALKAAYDQKKPFYHIDSHDPKGLKHGQALERYLDRLVESKNHLNLREKKNGIFYETCQIGTKIVLVVWDEDKYEFKRKDPGGTVEEVSTVRHSGPKIISIPDEDFFTREYVTDLFDAPWFGVLHHMTWPELKRREAQGIYANIDKIKSTGVSSKGENSETDLSRAGIDTGSTSDLYEIFECYVFWDVENDGKLVDVKIWFESSTGTVIREEYNDLGIRNAPVAKYYDIPGQFYGMGVCSICENSQDGIDALTNMGINSTHISSLQGFITKRGSGIGPDFKFRPLFQMECDVPREDFQPVLFPNTIQPNMAMASQLRNNNDRAVGANNALLGFPDTVAKTRSTASGYMFQAQQSSRSFNSVVENMDAFLSEVAMLVVFQLARHKDRVDWSLCGPEDEALLKEVFDLKPEEIAMKFGFSVTTTEVEETEQARQQAILTLSQLYSMYGQKLLGMVQGEIQLLMPFVQMGMKELMPKIGESLMQYLEFSNQFKVGSTSMMKDILKYFEVDGADKLANTKKIQMMLEYMAAMQEMQMGGVVNAIRQGSGAPGPQGMGDQGPGGNPVESGAMGGANGPGGGPDNAAGSGGNGVGGNGGQPG